MGALWANLILFSYLGANISFTPLSQFSLNWCKNFLQYSLGSSKNPVFRRFFLRFFGFSAARRCGRNFLYSPCYFGGPYLCRKKRIFQIGPVLFFIKRNKQIHTHTHTYVTKFKYICID